MTQKSSRSVGPLPAPPGSGTYTLRVDGDFAATGREIFDAYADVVIPVWPPPASLSGTERTMHVGGFNCQATDAAALAVMQTLLDQSDAARVPAGRDRPGYTGLLFVTTIEGRAEQLARKCAPGDGECCLFVDCSPGSGNELCTIVLGSGAGDLLRILVQEPGTSAADSLVGRWVTDVLAETNAVAVSHVIENRRLEGISLTSALPFLGFGLAVYSMCREVATAAGTVLRSAAGDDTPQLGVTIDGLQSPLDQWMQSELTKEAQDRYAGLDGTNDPEAALRYVPGMAALREAAPDAISGLESLLRSSWRSLPEAAWVFTLLAAELRANYARSRMVEQVQATLLFQKGLLKSLLSARKMSAALRANLQAAWDRLDQLWDLATIGSVVGGTAFLAGTICGVLYDLGETIMQLGTYSFAGMRWVFRQGKAQLEQAEFDDPAKASDATVAAWFPVVDLEALLTRDVPDLYRRSRDLCFTITDEFIAHAEEWGAMVGTYLWKAMGAGLESMLGFLFETCEASASYLSRVWYVVRQWFNLGWLLGPILVDIVLTFTTVGGGVVSGVLKLCKASKLGKLKALFRVDDATAALMRGFEVYARVEKLVPDLARALTRVLERVWEAIGPVRDRLLAVLNTLRDVDLKWWAATIDTFYDRASTINFFVGLFLAITGTSEVSEDGELLEAPA